MECDHVLYRVRGKGMLGMNYWPVQRRASGLLVGDGDPELLTLKSSLVCECCAPCTAAELH